MADTNYTALAEETEMADGDLMVFRKVSDVATGPTGFRVISKASLAAELAAAGDRGWTPVFALVSDGARRVHQLTGYIGGTGDEPTDNVNDYVGPSGYVSLIADATDIRGAEGAGGEGGGGPSDPSPIEAAILIDKRDAGSSGGYMASGVWVTRPLSEVAFSTSGVASAVAPKTCTATTGSPTLSAISTTGLAVGMQVYENSGGSGIPLGTVISAIGSGTVTLSANYTGTTGSKTVRFGGFTINDSGDYMIRWNCDCVGAGGAITRLINTLTGSEIGRGTSGYSAAGSIPLVGSVKVTVTTPTMYEVQMRTTSTNGDNAMGQANNFGVGESNIFSRVEVVKLYAPISTLGLDQVAHLNLAATRSQTTYDTVPQMSFPVTAGVQYAFHFRGFYSANGTGTGIGFRILGPTGVGNAGFSLAINTTTTVFKWMSSSLNDTSPTTAIAFQATSSSGAVPMLFEISGSAAPTADGFLTLQFKSELAGVSFVQIMPGTIGRVAISNP